MRLRNYLPKNFVWSVGRLGGIRQIQRKGEKVRRGRGTSRGNHQGGNRARGIPKGDVKKAKWLGGIIIRPSRGLNAGEEK